MAKLITLNDLTRFITNIKNLINNESTSIQAKLDKKLDLTTPGSEQTQYVMIKQYKDGRVVQISETGVFTPKADGYPNYMPVLRGLEGQLRGQTPPLANQTDLDLINRGELTEKLEDFVQNDTLASSDTYGLIKQGAFVETGIAIVDGIPKIFGTDSYNLEHREFGNLPITVDSINVAVKDALTNSFYKMNLTDEQQDTAIETLGVDKYLDKKIEKTNTPGIVYGNTNDGSLSSQTEIPYKSTAEADSLVYRDGEGFTESITPVQDLHTANKKYVDDSLTGYEKTPNYVLIEKVITGYTALTSEPEDFSANYANYYKTNGKARNDKDFNYVALTEAETFEAGKFYSYIDEVSGLTRNGDSGKEPDGTAYSFKNLYIYGETKDTSTYFADWGWVYFYINNSLLLRDAGFVYFSSASSKSHRGELFANVQGNSFRGYTTSLSNTEDNGSKINYSSMKFRDTEVTLTGINMRKLPAGTTILIYGVRK